MIVTIHSPTKVTLNNKIKKYVLHVTTKNQVLLLKIALQVITFTQFLLLFSIFSIFSYNSKGHSHSGPVHGGPAKTGGPSNAHPAHSHGGPAHSHGGPSNSCKNCDKPKTNKKTGKTIDQYCDPCGKRMF